MLHGEQNRTLSPLADVSLDSLVVDPMECL